MQEECARESKKCKSTYHYEMLLMSVTSFLLCRCRRSQSKLLGRLWQTQWLLYNPCPLIIPWRRYQKTAWALPALCRLRCPGCWAPICPRALGTRGQCQWLLPGVLEVPQGGSRLQATLTYCRASSQSALPNLVGIPSLIACVWWSVCTDAHAQACARTHNLRSWSCCLVSRVQSVYQL